VAAIREWRDSPGQGAALDDQVFVADRLARNQDSADEVAV